MNMHDKRLPGQSLKGNHSSIVRKFEFSCCFSWWPTCFPCLRPFCVLFLSPSSVARTQTAYITLGVIWVQEAVLANTRTVRKLL